MKSFKKKCDKQTDLLRNRNTNKVIHRGAPLLKIQTAIERQTQINKEIGSYTKHVYEGWIPVRESTQ